jgi:YVTN family beta-propeller protein
MRPLALISAAALAASLAGCGGGTSAADENREPARTGVTERSGRAQAEEREQDVYARTRAGMLSEATRKVPYRIYVPNSESDTVDIVDPKREKVVRSFSVGGLPQHVTPSPDLKTLWVNSNQGNTLQKINPRTARRVGDPIPVEDPYNLYFSLDGKTAIVMAERLQRLDFREARTMKLEKSVSTPCPGLNHADFSPDGRYFIASCEFGSAFIKVDTERRKVLDKLSVPRAGAMPQDVRISPDGRTFYSADMQSHGLVGHRRRPLPDQALHPHGEGRPRAVPEPRRARAVRRQPGRGVGLRARHPHRPQEGQVAHPRWRQPRHGRGLRGRTRAVVKRSLQQRDLRLQHPHRAAQGTDSRGQRPARDGGLAAARAPVARPHGKHPLATSRLDGSIRSSGAPRFTWRGFTGQRARQPEDG